MFFQLTHQNCLTQAPYCFGSFFQNCYPGHTTTGCFSAAAGTMGADENELLEELREFWQARDNDSEGLFIENLNASSLVNAENMNLIKLPMDILVTSLIPDIDNAVELQ